MNTPLDYSLYLVTDPALGGGRDNVAEIATAAVRGGATVVQLRDKELEDGDFLAHARQLREALGDTPLFLNDHFDAARELGLHLHLGQGDLDYIAARTVLPDTQLIGLTIENDQQLETIIQRCRDIGVRLPDVVGLGPVRETTTKLDAPPALGMSGVARTAAIARKAGIASVAIGGINPDMVAELAAMELDGICVVSAIMAAKNPEQAARELHQTFITNREARP